LPQKFAVLANLNDSILIFRRAHNPLASEDIPHDTTDGLERIACHLAKAGHRVWIRIHHLPVFISHLLPLLRSETDRAAVQRSHFQTSLNIPIPAQTGRFFFT
jgi:hypothetical protein